MSIIYIDDKAVPLIEGGGGGGCFSSDTLISIENGKKPISDIEVGDVVWAFDEIGNAVLSKVTETFYHAKDTIYRVTHETGILDITPNHWVLSKSGEYKELKDFNVGDYLIDSNNSFSKIENIEFLKNDEVYNFKVSHFHSYIANGIKVHNGGGGGKSGGGKETPNNLFSTDILFLLMGLGEGPVYRIDPHGPIDIEFNEGLIDDLLINNEVDTEKFFVLYNNGTIGQQTLPLFGNITFLPQRFSSAVELKKGNLNGVPTASVQKQNTSVTAATALKFYFIINGLQKQTSNGDIVGHSVSVLVTVFNRNGTKELARQARTIKGKTNQAFSFDIFIRIPDTEISDDGYRFTVEKTSEDSNSSKVQEQIAIHGWAELIEQPIAYTRTATLGYGLKAFAEHKGSLPAMTNIVKGLIVKVPSNYNQPILDNGEIDWRQVEVPTSYWTSAGYYQQKYGTTNLITGAPTIYEGIWDGQFVYSWTQNPVWHVYDMLTNKTYGLGIPEDRIDKFSFYDSAVYNDACDINTGQFNGVDAAADGTYRYKPKGYKTAIADILYGLDIGTQVKERRFIFDGMISDRKKIIDAINLITLTFRAILYYKAGKLFIYQDKPDEMPIAVFNETNILKDSFSISGIDEEEIITGVDITYIDPTNHYKAEVLRVDDPRALDERNSIENIASFQAEGVTRKSQAMRLAQYMIADKKYSRRRVNFKTSPHASDLRPGDVISVSQQVSSVSWGYGGIIYQDGSDAIANVKLEHISHPPITSTIFTSNSSPLALRIASSKSGLVDTYIISNGYIFTNTSNVSSGPEIVEVQILQKYNVGNKTFSAFSTFGTNHIPKRYDVWSLGEIQNPGNIYTSLTDKLFKVLNIQRDKDETVSLEATEYIANVYVDSDTLINYEPLYYADLFDPLKSPPPPNFSLTSIPKRDLDGSIYNDLVIGTSTDTTGYSTEIRTEFYRSQPIDGLKLISNTTPQADRNIVTVRLDDLTNMSNGSQAVFYGKNGFTFDFAKIPLLVTSYSVIDRAVDKANGNISFSITGLNNAIDINFGPTIHTLAVPNTFNFGGLKGTTRVNIPINQKTPGGTGDAAGLLGFIDSGIQVTNYSAPLVSYDLVNNSIKINNEHSNSATLDTLLPDPPFYISIPQIIDHRYFSNNALYVTGNFVEVVRTNVAALANVVAGYFKQPLGVSLKHKNFASVFINNIPTTDFTLETGLDNLSNSQVSIHITTLPTDYSNLDIRVVANTYTVPSIERGDNISFNFGNTFGVSNTTFDVGAPTYNAALTANSIYRIIVSDSIDSNVAQSTAVNITPNPVGLVGNLDTVSKTFTFEYNSNTYPGLLNLANSKIYTLNSPADTFTPVEFDAGATSRVISRVPSGVHAVKARNVNKYGRRSDFVTKYVTVRNIPIQAVTDLTINEELYKDSTIGVAIRVIINFSHITGQEVTDYEISYKINGSATGDLTSFNTITVNSAGVESDGKIRVKLDNIEKGISSNPNSIIVRVTPLNRNIRGSTIVQQKELVGKSAPPLNVVDFAVGQSGEALVFIWKYVLDSTTGDNYDLDLMEVQIRRLRGVVTDDLTSMWSKSEAVAIIDARTNRTVVDIDQYGTYTYLVRTKDTSGIFSESIVSASFTTIAQTYTNIYRAYSEDSPGVSYISGVTNYNSSEVEFPSFANSNTGGLHYSYTSTVDNANGTSSGWSVISGSPTDLRALANATYQTQIRDLGNTLTASLIVTAQGEQALKATWLDYATIIGSTAITEATTTGKLLDVNFSGALGIGNILGFSNASAATVSYNDENKTLVSGVSGAHPSNVYAIIAVGNYVGDTANANVFSLIAGVENANAIVLGSSWYANGISTGSNGFANLAIAGTVYKLVNLEQWIDLTDAATFSGAPGVVTTNLMIRTSTDSPYYANGNVNASVFTSVANSDGFTNFVAGARSFRYFQFKFNVMNSDPAQSEYLLDKFNYYVAVQERTFTDVITVDTLTKYIDYSRMSYTQIPKITAAFVSASSNQLAMPQTVIKDRGLQGANISVYFSNGVSAHGASTTVDFSVTGV